MNNWILLIISVLACLVGGIVKKQFTNKHSDSPFARHFYNLVCSVVAAAFLFAWDADLKVSVFTLTLAIVFGIVTALQQIFYLKAIETGPWSYASVITSLSTIIPALSGLVFWNEEITPLQGVGAIFMILCIFLSNDFKDDNKKKSLRWLIYCGIVFVTNGLIGVMQKWHQSTVYKDELGGFLIIAFATSFIYSAICVGIEASRNKDKKIAKALVTPTPIIIMIVAGVCAAVNHKLNLKLSGELPSVVFFPIVNGGNLILTTIMAVAFFKEKLTKKQWLGMAIGFAAVLLLCKY